MDFLADVGEKLAENGRSLRWGKPYPNRTAYNNAMYRLREAGLVVGTGREGRLPILQLTPRGKGSLPAYFRPADSWDAVWDGTWYIMVFDVPEKDRHYRDTLRGFLKRLRMGCLQKSVWITPRDIRSEYDALERAANINAVSYLLESRTVFHRETSELVADAWDFGRLRKLQERYLDVFRENLQVLSKGSLGQKPVTELLHMESEAYAQCMHSDPLLPTELLPANYLGKQVFELRATLRSTIAAALCTNLD